MTPIEPPKAPALCPHSGMNAGTRKILIGKNKTLRPLAWINPASGRV